MASDAAADKETERVRQIQDRSATRYDRRISLFEKVLFADGREWATSQARGDVLEIAVGTGRNLAFYAPEIPLTGIEISAEMLTIARRRASELGRPADLREGDAQSLEFAGERFDTVLITLSIEEKDEAEADVPRCRGRDPRGRCRCGVISSTPPAALSHEVGTMIPRGCDRDHRHPRTSKT